jgi:hypothetical protein
MWFLMCSGFIDAEHGECPAQALQEEQRHQDFAKKGLSSV